MSKKILLSGVKPTGRIHIGNYFGAIRGFLNLSEDYESYLMIADYHALNLIQNRDAMKEVIHNLVLDYLALEADKKGVIIFKQSDVSAHTELTWIFDTLVTVPYLQRAHAFKDAEAKNKEVSMGTFNYPVLMAADILLYENSDSVTVPVGQDQKQHIEYARDIAQKFNNTFGETFKMPEPLIMEGNEIIPGIDGRKMSKSYDNTIPLFATREEITKAVMSIVTDSSGEVPINVYAIHKLFKNEAELKTIYETNKGKYKTLKDILIEDIDAHLKPLREKRQELAQNPDLVREVLQKGGERAQAVAQAKLIAIKKKIGVL